MSSLTPHHTVCKKRKVVNVILLNGEHLQVFVDVKSKFQDVFNQVTTHLNLREVEYFGLAQKRDGEYLFVELEEKIHKQAPKAWKSGNGEGVDVNGQPILNVYFRVHFYVDQFVLLREKVTRHLYYLQLKENVLNYNHVCSEEKCFQMVSYALQADLGNYNPARHGEDYFDPRVYFPAWMVERRGEPYIVKNAPVIHKDLQNLTKSESELRFIKEASMSPAAHNLHFYRLKKKKTDKIWNAWLGICAKGIEIYEEMESMFKNLISTFLWPDIGKLYFEKKKFEIRSVGSTTGQKFTYYTDCDTKSKYLLHLCRTTHMFQMAIKPKLMEIRHLDEEDKRRYREAYIYSDTRDLVANGGSFRGNLSPSSKSATTRYSVVSDASSNTTSGIASDKMTVSFEESDDHSQEIIIDAPPGSGYLMASPSQTRGKQAQHTVIQRDGVVSTLPNYMPSSKSCMNRSPVLDNRPSELYKSASVGRPGGVKPLDTSPLPGRLGARKLSASPRIQHSDRVSPTAAAHVVQISDGSVHSGNSSNTLLSSTDNVQRSPTTSSGGSFHGRLPQQPPPPPPPSYNSPRTVPVYVAHTSSFGPSDAISFTQPVSRSTSRADSFKNTAGHMQIHTNEGYIPAAVGHMHVNSNDSYIPPMSSVQASAVGAHVMEAIAGNIVLSTHPSMPPAMGNIPMITNCPSALSEEYIQTTEVTLPEASQEYLAPPPMFADSSVTREHSSHTLSSSSSSSLPEQKPVSKASSVEDMDADVDENPTSDTSMDDGAKAAPTQISVKNQKEILHPELQEIRGQPNAFSLPLITALCNDKSLMHTNSQNSSKGEVYDMASMKSPESGVIWTTHDMDPRRLSSCYPSNSGTMVSLSSTRPFSWHSEYFDLDAQLAAMGNGLPVMPNSVDNHRSVPQDLSGIMMMSNSSWAHTVAHDLAFRQMSDRYSPETIASQLMIPPKLSSGGHNSTDRNISQKALKETVGIA